MKKTFFSRITAILLSVVMLSAMFTMAISADESCNHDTQKKIVENDSGFKICEICKLCNKTIGEVISVSDSMTINLYKNEAKTSAYTEDELATGFASANGKALYVDDGVISTVGTPYWFNFDLKINGVPTIPEGDGQADLSSSSLRAYKGWSIVCLVHSTPSYDTVLRLIPDGWETDSGASGNKIGTLDKSVPVKGYAKNDGFRNKETFVDIKEGQTVSFNLRIDPATGGYDVYADKVWVGSGNMPTQTKDNHPLIRLWEGNGKDYGGLLDYTNISIFSESIVEEEEICFHSKVKSLLETSDGYTIADVCSICKKTVTEIGYVDSGDAITLYKEASKTNAYTSSELASGFTKAKGNGLYLDSGIISLSGVPYWLTFDLDVNSLPLIAEGDAQADLDADTRAYKGWSVICMVVGGSYVAPLRLIPDGWEADSGAEGTTKGNSDGKAPIKYYGSVYRDQDTVVDVKEGDSMSFALRADPSTGNYDIYIDGLYIGNGRMGTSTDGTGDHIRLWEENGNAYNANLDFTNIRVFKDNYTVATHAHSYTEVFEFSDTDFYRYNLCDCGVKERIESEKIVSSVVDGMANIYNGYGNFEVNAADYLFVTDINIRDEINDGSLVTFGNKVLLEVYDGKLMSNGKSLGKIAFPTTYQISVKVTQGAYTLYVNGMQATNGTLSNTQNIICGNESLGYHVRFLYNKAVKLGETATPIVPTYANDKSAKLCYHSDDGMSAIGKTLVHTKDGVKYIYNCTLCGERVYSMLKNDLTNPANDTAYKYKPNAIMREEFSEMITERSRYLYLENNVISNTADPYWLIFDVTPNTVPSNATGDLGDPNSRVYKGYALVSTEAAFLPVSELRVIPDGWEEGNASGKTKGITDGKCEVKMIKPSEEAHIGMDALNYRHTETVAYLEVGKTTSFALRIDPKTGIYDVYVDGIYKASSVKETYTDMTPKIVFHDNGAGNYTYSNISVCGESRNFDDKVIAVELNAKFEANAKSSPNVYTALLAIEREGVKYNLFYVNNKNGTLEFRDENGKFNTLYDVDGNIVYLNESQNLAAVYDDNGGDIRYFVNGKLAQYMDGEDLVCANEIKVYNTDFVNAQGGNYALRFNPTVVNNLNIIGLGKTDTAEIVGFQLNDFDNSIRLLSGVDCLYYGIIGYEVQAYKADGSPYKDMLTNRSSNTVYSSVIADEETITASKHGYNYFSALKIEGDFLGYKDSYVIVKPFTKIGDKTYYGEAVRLNILDNGRYEFAENN